MANKFFYQIAFSMTIRRKQRQFMDFNQRNPLNRIKVI